MRAVRVRWGAKRGGDSGLLLRFAATRSQDSMRLDAPPPGAKGPRRSIERAARLDAPSRGRELARSRSMHSPAVPLQTRESTPAFRQVAPRHAPAFAFFCAYSLFVVYATLLPFQFTTDREMLAAKREWINWNPLVMVTGEPTPVTDLVMNVAFFVPLGFIAFHGQRRRATRSAVLRAAVVGFALTTTVEALQFFTPSRNPATSDVFTNTLGATLGALLAALFRIRLEDKLRRGVTVWRAREPLLPVLGGYGLLVTIAAVVPFDLAPSVQRSNVPCAPPASIARRPLDWAEALQTAIRMRRSGSGDLCMSRLRPGRAVPVFSDAGRRGGLAVALELRSAGPSRSVDARCAAALSGGRLGVLAAMALGSGRRRDSGGVGRRGVRVSLRCGARAVPVRSRPAGHAQPITYTALIPYSSYYFKANIAAVADLLEGLLAYLPLAFVLAQMRAKGGRGDRRDDLAVMGSCALYAFILEVVQLGLPRRHPEVSDVLTAALGAGLGAYAWRWVAAFASPPALSSDATFEAQSIGPGVVVPPSICATEPEAVPTAPSPS